MDRHEKQSGGERSKGGPLRQQWHLATSLAMLLSWTRTEACGHQAECIPPVDQHVVCTHKSQMAVVACFTDSKKTPNLQAPVHQARVGVGVFASVDVTGPIKGLPMTFIHLQCESMTFSVS